MTTLIVASTTSDSILLVVLGAPFGLWLTVTGRNSWRGIEPSFIAQHQAEHGPTTTPTPAFGGVRLYQSVLGATFAGGPAGATLALLGVVEGVRVALGQPEDWEPVSALAVVTAAASMLTFLYLFAYFWVGVPDWMRPPAQRGWRLTKHGYELVRPDAVPPHLREPQQREQEPW